MHINWRKTILFTLLSAGTSCLMSQGNILQNGDFQAGQKAWKLSVGYTITPNGGHQDSAALRYVRTSPRQYSLAIQDVNLKPGKFYELKGMVKTLNIKGNSKLNGGGGTFCMMFHDAKGTYLGGIYPVGDTSGCGEWKEIRELVPVPNNCARSQFSAYLRKGMTGEVMFDQISLCEVSHDLLYPVAPSAQAVHQDQPYLKLHVLTGGKQASYRCEATVTTSSGEHIKRSFPVINQEVIAKFNGFPLGTHQISWSLIDNDTARRNYAFQAPITILPSQARAKGNACWIDQRGIAHLANGKKFMPIGFFMSNLPKREVDDIAATGLFNTLMPYLTRALSIDDKGGLNPANQNFKSIKEALDYCHSKNIHIIFSLKDFHHGMIEQWNELKNPDDIVTAFVNRFKDHPALLAWYAFDELPLSRIPALQRRRNLINRLDPNHPVWGVQDQPNMPLYSPAMDIAGIDPYPINSVHSADMSRVTLMSGQAQRTKLPLWVCPQIHDLGIYSAPRQPALWKNFRSPTAREMRSMCLQMANCGARGFMFWSYYNLYRPPFKTRKDYDITFKAVCETAALLKKLEPYLLSDTAPRAVQLHQASGVFTAQHYAIKNSEVVLITANGPGKSEAFFSLNAKYSSTFNRTTRLADGTYRFIGQDIDCDVLVKTDK